MRLPELPRKLMRWDAWEAFHWGVNTGGVISTGYWRSHPFVVFETGEVITTWGDARPDRRCLYEALNVSLVATQDGHCPKLAMPDDTPVPRAWLYDQGQQHLLIDHDLNLAFRTDGMRSATHERIPERFKNKATVYYPGPGRTPVADDIALHIPASNKRFVTSEEREHIETIYLPFRAEATMKEMKWSVSGWWPDHYRKLPFDRLLEVQHWSELSDKEQHRLFHRGVGRKTIRVPHLKVLT
jgi:hypothetical protein